MFLINQNYLPKIIIIINIYIENNRYSHNYN